jgi:DMSO/TMAO reductase YedYZ molybdopterin-dependent catalytic subunit
MFTFDELRRLPSRRFTATLECAGNNRIGFAPLPKGEPWDTGAVSTATWRGVSLSTIIHQAGLLPSTVEILFNGADHGRPHDHDQEVQFGRSLPLAKALDPDTLLVYEMNDEPLTPEHGGPVRLLVPDWYGMASVKWLTGITALDHPFTGYFQTKRYVYQLPDQAEPVPVCTMQVKSLIIAPEPGVTLPPGRHVISGLAWSGAGAIRAVEVSVGGDCGWQTAQLWDEEQAYTWRRWVWTWEVREPGRHVLRVRATDEQGNTQPDVAPWNRLGYGNNAVRSTVVYIRD